MPSKKPRMTDGMKMLPGMDNAKDLEKIIRSGSRHDNNADVDTDLTEAFKDNYFKKN